MIEGNSPKGATTNDLTTVPSGVMTKEEFRQALPGQIKNRISPQVMNSVNQVLKDPIFREHFKENLLSYTSVLQSGKYKLASYVDAVKYVSFKLMGLSNQDAYAKTFPNRMNTLIAEGASDKAISAYVAAYNKTKLVNAIWEQTLIPTWVLNAATRQKAINVQSELMLTAKSEKVRCDAAATLIRELAPPETAKLEVDIGIKENSSIEELRQAALELATQQRKLIEGRQLSAEDVAHSKIVVNHDSGELEEDDDAP